MIHLQKTLRLLSDNEIGFVILGGVAAGLHGSTYATYDLDICYSRDPGNLQRLADAISPLHPRLRGAPSGLPFLWDVETLKRGLNFTLTTDWGELDLMGEIAGLGSYQQVLSASVLSRLWDLECRVLTLDALIAAKRAAGREKDLLVLKELEALREATEGD